MKSQCCRPVTVGAMPSVARYRPRYLDNVGMLGYEYVREMG